jgi:hypothetical protein
MGQEFISHTNEGHGTTLMLLLRNVFEIALHRRQEEPDDDMRLNAHEIDELLVLDGNSKSWRESWFPFNLAANIKVPFDILESLGVDIFQRPEFDTWIIQIILRKLLVNAVPWDPRRLGEVSDRLATDRNKKLYAPDVQFERMEKGEPLMDIDPSLQNLYLFPGLSMFNHSCAGSHNADWGYDKLVPNRVIVWATRNIAQGEEIRVRYRNHAIKSQRRATRLFGGPCKCPRCRKDPPRPQTPDSENFSDQTYPSEEEPELVFNPLRVPYEKQNDSEGPDPLVMQIAQGGEEQPAYKEHAVVEDGKVVIYRELSNRKPPQSLSQKRKLEEMETEKKAGEREMEM